VCCTVYYCTVVCNAKVSREMVVVSWTHFEEVEPPISQESSELLALIEMLPEYVRVCLLYAYTVHVVSNYVCGHRKWTHII
jgi:uncharacterized OB-fold protein